MKLRLHATAAVLTFISLSVSSSILGATYTYNGPEYGQENSGVLSGGSLKLEDRTSWVSAVFTKGSAVFDQGVVIYVDSVSGGFANTLSFADTQNDLSKLVSGYGGSRSVASFATGFQADYAIVLLPSSTQGAVYQLNSGGAGSMTSQRSFSLSNGFNGDNNAYYFSFNYSDINLPDGANNTFKFETTYLTPSGWRYLQSLEGITGTEGYNSITFNNYDVFGVTPVPEMTNVSLGIFGGVVVLAGLGGNVWRSRRERGRRED